MVPDLTGTMAAESLFSPCRCRLVLYSVAEHLMSGTTLFMSRPLLWWTGLQQMCSVCVPQREDLSLFSSSHLVSGFLFESRLVLVPTPPPSSVSQGGPEVPRLHGQTQQLPPGRPAHQRGGHVEHLEGL